MKYLLLSIAFWSLVQVSTCQRCQQGNYTQFQCTNGNCVDASYLCDGDDDCKDGSDEFSDPDKCPVCDPDEFRCKNGHCVDFDVVCDGDNDCGDCSDEPANQELCYACQNSTLQNAFEAVLGISYNETLSTNGTKQFRCDNGRYIPAIFVCDHENDCGDASDERQNCPPCPKGSVQCSIGGCIPVSSGCRRTVIQNCQDGTSQANCTVAPSTSTKAPSSTPLVKETSKYVSKIERKGRKSFSGY